MNFRVNSLRAASATITVFALLMLIHLVKPDNDGPLPGALFDAGHAVVFGLIALAILAATPRHVPLPRRLGTALLLSMLLGIISEALQIPLARDASLQDLAADWLGAGSALCFSYILAARKASFAARATAGVAGLALAALAFSALARTAGAYWLRDQEFPTIVSFDSGFIETFMRRRNASVAIVETPEKTVGRVTFLDGPWPTVEFHNLSPDWSRFDDLIINITVSDGRELGIEVRIHDRLHEMRGQSYTDRFNRHLDLLPGKNHIRISLDDVASAPASRTMDLTEIRSLIVFGRREQAGRSFDIDSVELTAAE